MKFNENMIREIELQWFQDYLFNRSVQTCVQNTLSVERPVVTGVSQGSILGPLLFLVYLYDVALELKQCKIIIYADDMFIYLGDNDFTVIENKLNDDMSSLSQ